MGRNTRPVADFNKLPVPVITLVNSTSSVRFNWRTLLLVMTPCVTLPAAPPLPMRSVPPAISKLPGPTPLPELLATVSVPW